MSPPIHGRDRTVLGRIFHHPTGRNVEWREVLAFVERIVGIDAAGDAAPKRPLRWIKDRTDPAP